MWSGLWDEAGSNCRHKDFQSFALPTELSSQKAPVKTGVQMSKKKGIAKIKVQKFSCINFGHG